MTEIILVIITSAIASSGMFKFIEYMISRRDKKKGSTSQLEKDMNDIKINLAEITKEVQELHEDDLTLMHDRIYQAFRYALPRDSITVEDRANIDYIWSRYSARGGNHKANLMYEQIEKIPVEKSHEDI